MKDVVKVSTVSFHAKWGDKKCNLNRMKGFIEEAAKEGSKIIVFPEMALTGYDDEEDKPLKEKMQYREAETIPGEASDEIAALTKKLGVYVAFGMPERDPEDFEKLYNSACVCGPNGIIGSYRKIHLPYPEYHWAKRGEKPLIFDTEWGPVGISICYDTYCFPEMSRYYAAKGCRIHINCTAHAKCHGRTLARNSIEAHSGTNAIYMISSNLVGVDLYNDFWGGSSIVGPSTFAFESTYYGGYPFATDEGYREYVATAIIDLGLAKRTIFVQNPGIHNATDFRPVIYKALMEDLLTDAKFLRTEYDES